MREIGSRGGKRGRYNKQRAELLPERFGDYLARNVPPAELWNTLKLTMDGDNASARVQAARVAIDAIAEWQRREEQRGRDDAGPVVVEQDVSAEQADAILDELEKVGLIARGEPASQVAELRARVEELEAKLAAIPQAVREEFAAS